ncbi:MAG: radical SAM protein [Desulfobacterium sp.]|nr:radical SAM protein [Desulfobacterium sp.]MBU3950426.1 radical SAM protein [Pseudomonadota bacterium]MBU4037263.1 radical SAM protein [Pseudomonadota bacterium]
MLAECASKLNNFSVSIESGLDKYSKATHPIRYGNYIKIRTEGYEYIFDLNGRAKIISGKRHNDWPREDWLKRTKGNDWIFYTAGMGYSNAFAYEGEYYTLCLNYNSNSVFDYKPFKSQYVLNALDSLQSFVSKLKNVIDEPACSENKVLLNKIINNNSVLPEPDIHSIIKSSISVLPPDTRHSDYDVIPVIIADGCVYNCSFCSVKSGEKINIRNEANIALQLNQLREFYGEDIINYNSVFLGNHDALVANESIMAFAIGESYKLIKNTVMLDNYLYLFGSIFSLLNADEEIFSMLDDSPFHTYINIGFESFDQTTLDLIGKPVKADDSKKAFKRMIEINRKYSNIEITGNFIIGSQLPTSHLTSMQDFINENIPDRSVKGCIYLSPLIGERDNDEIKRKFHTIKYSIRMPVYVYLIQRL